MSTLGAAAGLIGGPVPGVSVGSTLGVGTDVSGLAGCSSWFAVVWKMSETIFSAARFLSDSGASGEAGDGCSIAWVSSCAAITAASAEDVLGTAKCSGSQTKVLLICSARVSGTQVR